MSRSRLWLLAPALLLIGFLWLLNRGDRISPRESSRHAPAAAPPRSAPEEELFAAGSGPKVEREADLSRGHASVPSTPAPEAPTPVLQELRSIRGQTLDVNGQAMSHIDLVFGSDSAIIRTSSDSSGRFQLELEREHWNETLQAFEGAVTTMMSCNLGAAEGKQFNCVVVAPAVSLAGRVIDQTGRPLEGVRIAPRRWRPQASSFPYPLDRGKPMNLRFLTDENGHFSQAGIPSLSGHDLYFSMEGFEGTSIPIPNWDQLDLTVELQGEPTESMLRGRVLLPDHSPAVGATVNFNGEQVHTDEAGQFALSVDIDRLPDLESGQSLAIAASMQTHGAAYIEDLSGTIRLANFELPQNLELVLTQHPLSIIGKVIDNEGQALAGWQVTLSGGLALSYGQIPMLTAESLSGSKQALSDEFGVFEFTGLLERDYQLWAYDPQTLRSTQPIQTIPAGEQAARLILGADDYYPEVRGVVLSVDGVPQVGTRVYGSLVTMRSNGGSMSIQGGSVVTDSEGRFLLTNVGKYEVTLGVSGDDYVPSILTIEEGMDPLNLRLVANQRCHFRLFIEGVGEGSQNIQFLDQAGTPLSIYSFQNNGWSSRTSASINPRSPGVMAVSDAAIAVLVGHEDPVRHSIQLTPGQVTELRLKQ